MKWKFSRKTKPKISIFILDIQENTKNDVNSQMKIVFYMLKCFNSISEMKISHVNPIVVPESSISYVTYLFRIPTFHTWNCEPVHLTCELGISYVKTFLFLMWNENFTCENKPIPYLQNVEWQHFDMTKRANSNGTISVCFKNINNWSELNNAERPVDNIYIFFFLNLVSRTCKQ